MYISALYLKDHFLFDQPQTINFGGKYIYDFSNILGITRKPNERYIENFYSNKNLELVSAIVGRNGTGKTTLLRDLISFLNDRGYGYDYILFLENENITYKVSSKIVYGCDFVEKHLDIILDTIYYSPYLDFKESIEGIDLSYDAFIEQDFKEAENKYFEDNKIDYKRWLKSRNSIRILEFQSSKYSNELNAFFDFPEIKRARISFIRHKIDVDYESNRIKFHNTPFDLQFYIHPLYYLIQKESEDINKERPKGYSHVNLQKELFKNYIIMDVLCLLIKQMEKTNQYLREGHLEISTEKFEELIQELSSKEALFKFLDLHYFYGKEIKVKILPVEETKEMIDYLFEIIDNLEAKDDRDTRNFDWNNKSIYLGILKTRELIEYHSKFLNKVDQYYGGLKDEKGYILFQKSERIEGLISYEPSERNLSSGETAILNFYSRIYYYFKKNIIELESIKRKDFYIIFLDEADMGFHPKWKKAFVKSITTFLPNFFNSLDSKIQIIFTTHDPLTLSDIPNSQITYLDKTKESNIILSDSDKPQKSFGANITDLLADSFFVDDGLIGDFARSKIEEVIMWLRNDKKDLSKKDYYKSIVNIIDEPIIQRKLSEMYDKIFNESLELQTIEMQIEELNRLKSKLNK
jgi:hypothetical protein